MGVIDERAQARRAAIQGELRARFPGLFPKPPASPVDRTAIALGRDLQGAAVLLPQRPRLEHSHIIGTTGGGKSHLCEHMMRQDVVRGHGVLFVDPHADHPRSQYRSFLSWLETSGYARKRTVHVIDANVLSRVLGFNPLALPDSDTDLSVVAGAALEAFSRAWGDEDTSQKPTIERVLTVTFTTLAELGLTLVEAPMLLDRADRYGLRAFALDMLEEGYARDELERLHELSLNRRRDRDFDLEVLGPMNRLARFVRPPAIRAMLGQTDQLLDFRKAFDEGHIILCNASGGSRIYQADADMLARLLVRTVFFHAKRRLHPERPFFLYLDECHRYLSGDVESMLAESRKYGIGVVLLHQWLEQLRTHGDNTLAAIRNATNVKLVFRLKDPREAEDLAHMVVPLNLEVPVQALTRPTVVGHRRIRLANETAGTSTSHSRTQGLSRAETNAEGFSVAYTSGESVSEGIGRSRSIGQNVSEGFTSGVSKSASVSEGYTSGVSSGVSASEGVTSGVTSGASMSEGVSSGVSHGESVAHGASTMATMSAGVSVSLGAVMLPTEEPGLFAAPEEPTILTENVGLTASSSESLGVGASSTHGASTSLSQGTSAMRGVSASQSESKSATRGVSSALSEAKSLMHGNSSALSEAKSATRGRSTSIADSESRSVGRSSAVSRAHSFVQAHSIARSQTKGETQGESESRGTSEALEPILEDRPSSVHSRDNILYMAAQALRGLKTGHAFLNYVGASGMLATRLVVPPIKECTLPDATFVALRERLLSESAATIPTSLAQARIKERQSMFRSFTQPGRDDIAEPVSFRITVRADAPGRAFAGPVAPSRALSGPDTSEAVIDATPLTDGGQEQAEPARSQGSRSLEATARGAALDGVRARPKKARHAVKGEPRNPSKV